MKKLFALILSLALVTLALPALAQEATVLPLGLTFQMDFDAAAAALGADKVAKEEWDEGVGSLTIQNAPSGIGDLQVDQFSCQIDRNNSAKVSRLSTLNFMFPIGDNSIADFRAVLTALTAMYGAPDSDPFDTNATQGYVEYGNLSATWTKPDARINLSLSRMFTESLSMDIANRLCYDAADLTK
ncbi:MAG: hypothetical protein RR065_03315 [Clostridia bacterium]